MPGIRSDGFYYVRTMEKTEIAFLDMFNNIKINKYKKLDRKEIIKTLKVPITIHTDKDFSNWYVNTKKKKPLLPIPIMGLRAGNPVQNHSGRTQNTYCRQIFSKATDQWIRDIQPTPYILNYTLSFLCVSRSDYGQFAENILPYFNTSRYLRIKEWDFAPDIENKVMVVMGAPVPNFGNEYQDDAKQQFIELTIPFTLEVDLYRPFEFGEIIKYAELNINTDGIIGKHQALVYPTDAIVPAKQDFEQVIESQVPGYSILKTILRTTIKTHDLNGNTVITDISDPDLTRPLNVPDIKQLDLWFDDDTDNEIDKSPYQRNFTALNSLNRTYVADLNPGSGQNISSGGYQVDTSVAWNQILSWFGAENGEIGTPFTFNFRGQFNENEPTDIIFQQLFNKETTTIPANSVFFEWGLEDAHLYFRFATYGNKAVSNKFITRDSIILNDSDIYTFVFALYNKGNSGLFAYQTNSEVFVGLLTEKV